MRKPKYRTRPDLCPTCHSLKHVVDGAFLREVREARGISLRQMARNLGLSAAYISDIERNRRGCSHAIECAYNKLRDDCVSMA